MEFFGQILLDAGCVACLIGYFCMTFCAFAVGTGRGLLSLVFPWIGFGAAMHRFPWILWLWGGGITCMVLGAICV